MSKEFSLSARFSLNTEPFEKALKSVRKHVRSFDRAFSNALNQAGTIGATLAKPFAALSGVGAISLSGAVSQFVTLGDSIDKAALRAGVATGALQRLRVAAMLSGMRQEQMDNAIAKLSLQLGKAASGQNANLVQMFKELNIQWKDSSGKARDAASVMREIADAVKANEDPTKRAIILNNIFGDDLGKFLVPALKDGAAGLDEMAKKADDLGTIIDPQDVQNAAALGDKFGIFKLVIDSLIARMGGKLAPILMKLIDKFQAIVVANRELISNKAAEAVNAMSNALDRVDFAAIGDGISTSLKWISRFIDAMGGLGNILKVVAAFFAIRAVNSVLTFALAIAGVVKVIAGIVVAIGALPVAIGAAIVAAVGALWYFWDDITAWFDRVKARYTAFVEKFPAIAKSPFGFIVAAVASLSDSLFSTLSEWLDVIQAKMKEVVNAVLGTVKTLWQEIKNLFSNMVDSVVTSIVKTASRVKDAFKGMITDAFNTAMSWAPDWFKDWFSDGKTPSTGASTLKSAAPPSYAPVMAGAGMNGELTISLKAADGTSAQIEEMKATNGQLKVDSVGRVSTFGDF